MKKVVKRRRRNRFRQFGPLYIMALPGIVYLLVNNYIPMIGIVLAFKNYNVRQGIFGSPWAGLKNFEYLFRTQDAFVITRNTLLYNLAFIVIGTVLSVLTAILLNEIKNRFLSKFFQTVVLIPYLVSIVIVSYIVYAFLSMDTGLLNNVIEQLAGKEGILWYNEAEYWPFILIFVHTWKFFGFNAIVYYAAVLGIDANLYEAAMVDGASRVQQIWSITLPGLKPTIITMTILAVGKIFYSDFGLFYQVPMNSGALYDVTDVIDTYVYRALFNLGDYSMSSAAAFYQSVVGFVLVLMSNAVVRKIDRDNALF